MIRRAFICPGARRSNLLLAIAMGSATILLGCGGGGGGSNGGGGGGGGQCPGASGSGSIVCGYVQSDAGTAVPNATVTFEDLTNHSLGTATTNSSGYYWFRLGSASGALMKVEAKAPFYSNTMKYNQVVFAYYINSSTGGECIPQIAFAQGTQTMLSAATVYDAGSPPPVPAYPCPR